MNGNRFQTIEVVIPANTSGTLNRFKIGDQPQLRSTVNQVVKVYAIRSYNDAILTKSPMGIDVVPEQDFSNAYLVLNIDGREDFLYIPLADLNNATASDHSVQEIYKFDTLIGVDWSKSYILNSDTVTQTAHSYLLGVWYSVEPAYR